jgi:hypothetical protein
MGIPTFVDIHLPHAVLHGFCDGPNATSFTVGITTNGLAMVVYRIDIYNGDGSFRNSPGETSLTFAAASTQTFDPGGSYHTDCGSFYIIASTSSPNSKSARADWSVVEP